MVRSHLFKSETELKADDNASHVLNPKLASLVSVMLEKTRRSLEVIIHIMRVACQARRLENLEFHQQHKQGPRELIYKFAE